MILVEAVIDFDDYMGKTINPNNKCIARRKGDTWEVDVDRANYLTKIRHVKIRELV